MAENGDVNYNLIIMAISSIISFIVGWGLSVLNEKQKRNKMITQSFKSMISELNDIKTELAKTKLPLIKFGDVENESMTVNFSYGNLTIASYESMLFSGVLREIDVKTQREIIDLYEHIKLYNDMKSKIHELITITTSSVKPLFINNLKNHNKSTEDVFKKVKTKIDEVLETLDSYD